jgi:tRNA pseudouridine55 synthase
VTRTPTADGLLLVDKPAGMTSHDVVAIARRALGVRRVGHAGTLDPFATGLLVLLVGKATRLLPFLDGEPKVYDATLRFGAETDTDDATGKVTREAPLPDERVLEDAIASLTGSLLQHPPAYSAKQVDGTRAYRAARAGNPLELPAVAVTVYDWTVRDHSGSDWRVTIRCGSGTYVRALARDVGRLAKSAAHLSELRRTGSGPFHLAEAATMDTVSASALRPMRDAVRSLPAQTLDDEGLAHVLHGRLVPATTEGQLGALVDAEGVLVAVADRLGDQWHPRLVLREK